MSDTVVSLLTPPGTGAIATVEVRGPRAWELARKLFTPAGKPLPEAPELHRFWFGTLGSDEVILATTAPNTIEVHGHGGRRVVRWVIDQFLSHECIEERTLRPSDEGFELLQRAPTLRTASIILDQLNGAFANEVRRILALLEIEPQAAWEPLDRLNHLGGTVGRHLMVPWKVVVAGPPNVGKSSLINALAGYQRSVVSETAGTTRDAVSVQVAFDGWPIELVDTAGLRKAQGLEAEGIGIADELIHKAEAVIWVIDSTDPKATLPYSSEWPLNGAFLCVANKCDQPAAYDLNKAPCPDTDGVPCLPVSAITGEGLGELIRDVTHGLIYPIPQVLSGASVPYSPRLADMIAAAWVKAYFGEWESVSAPLREALALAESHHTAGPSVLPSKP